MRRCVGIDRAEFGASNSGAGTESDELHENGANGNSGARTDAVRVSALSCVSTFTQERAMKICPIAVVAGCAKCPIYKPCPLKGVIGDYVKPDEKSTKTNASKPSNKAKK